MMTGPSESAHDPGRTETGTPGFRYEGASGVFDETVASGGVLRAHWHSFFEGMGALGLPELSRRWEEARHLIRENGVTYNVYGDPRGMDRPWELDPIPLLIAPDDAATIEAGLAQRARLLDRVLADLYGPQTSLTAGVLPPELVFGHPGFLRPCCGLKVPGDRYLHLYAADLGRGLDGRYFVFRDRTQAPSGAGYALENRLVLARVLPEVFRDCRVQRLALFFRTLRETLRSIARRNGDNPRIVLLTPGPFNETYFEHAFLARYLGYTLVEGGDLTVRDDRVYLKLLEGLQPVDVILRRLDAEYCDPLELRGDSFLGAPGLVQAARAGNVAVANALGSGLIETPAVLAFLPSLCRFLLGEELVLPSVATWWCGQPEALRHVLASLERLVIKPTFPGSHYGPIFGEQLSKGQLRSLAETIRALPSEFVGQEALQLSTSPILVGDRLRPRRIVVRVFLAATGATFTAMPGGLTRIAASDDSLVVSMQRGSGSKDTWVIASGPVSEFSLLPKTVQPVELSRGGGDLPSRAADDLFWLGRYIERVECAVRLLRSILLRLTERSGLVDAPELPSLLRTLTFLTRSYPGFMGAGADGRIDTPSEELLSVIFDPGRTGSLAATIDTLHRVASRARDRISIDMWRTLSKLDLRDDPALEHRQSPDAATSSPDPGPGPSPRIAQSEVLDLLDRTVITLSAFSGLLTEGMTRGQGWRFLDIGRRLERSLQLLGLLRSTLVWVNRPEGPLLEALLEILDSTMTYRRRYMSSLQAAPVLDLVVADENNPRSLAFQLVTLSACIDFLPRAESTDARDVEPILPARALGRLREARMDQLAKADPSGRRPDLERLLTQIETDLPHVSDYLTRNYLSHLQAARQYASGTL
jgi:uncharacterized circularly permuted ATP-grasp superfamily protein/uncharacterized alpha-E superfamily protein